MSSIKLGSSVQELEYADGAVWAADGGEAALVRIEATTDTVRPYVLGHVVDGHRACMAACWQSSVQPAGKDVTAGLKGRIAVVALPVDDLDATSTDPLGTQFAFNAAQVQFHYATCAKLFNYPDADGADGRSSPPRSRQAAATVTDSGRTYTFRIRSGFGFSPPSHEQVTADSFRHALERYLSPAGGNYDPLRVLGDIVGADAYAAGKSPHVSGVSAHGDTLVIHLRRPAGDLPARLSLPSFCAVPADLPTVPHGLPYPIPSAGPYYLADRSRDVFVLKPNPNYHGPRPRRLDAIVYKVGIEPGVGGGRDRRSGTFDYVASQDAAPRPTHGGGPLGRPALSPDREQLDGAARAQHLRGRRSRTRRSAAPLHLRSIVAGSPAHSTTATSSCRPAPCFPPTFVALRDPCTRCAPTCVSRDS